MADFPTCTGCIATKQILSYHPERGHIHLCPDLRESGHCQIEVARRYAEVINNLIEMTRKEGSLSPVLLSYDEGG